MADTNERTPSTDNQTIRNEQAKSSVSGSSPQGSDRSPETSQLDKKSDRESDNKSAIGGGETRSQTGEPGRARDELDTKNKEPAGTQR